MLDEKEFVISPVPKFNLKVSFGGSDAVIVSFSVKRSFVNRFRYWMLCKFFPFKIERWD